MALFLVQAHTFGRIRIIQHITGRERVECLLLISPLRVLRTQIVGAVTAGGQQRELVIQLIFQIDTAAGTAVQVNLQFAGGQSDAAGQPQCVLFAVSVDKVAIIPIIRPNTGAFPECTAGHIGDTSATAVIAHAQLEELAVLGAHGEGTAGDVGNTFIVIAAIRTEQIEHHAARGEGAALYRKGAAIHIEHRAEAVIIAPAGIFRFKFAAVDGERAALGDFEHGVGDELLCEIRVDRAAADFEHGAIDIHAAALNGGRAGVFQEVVRARDGHIGLHRQRSGVFKGSAVAGRSLVVKSVARERLARHRAFRQGGGRALAHLQSIQTAQFAAGHGQRTAVFQLHGRSATAPLFRGTRRNSRAAEVDRRVLHRDQHARKIFWINPILHLTVGQIQCTAGEDGKAMRVHAPSAAIDVHSASAGEEGRCRVRHGTRAAVEVDRTAGVIDTGECAVFIRMSHVAAVEVQRCAGGNLRQPFGGNSTGLARAVVHDGQRGILAQLDGGVCIAFFRSLMAGPAVAVQADGDVGVIRDNQLLGSLHIVLQEVVTGIQRISNVGQHSAGCTVMCMTVRLLRCYRAVFEYLFIAAHDGHAVSRGHARGNRAGARNLNVHPQVVRGVRHCKGLARCQHNLRLVVHLNCAAESQAAVAGVQVDVAAVGIAAAIDIHRRAGNSNRAVGGGAVRQVQRTARCRDGTAGDGAAGEIYRTALYHDGRVGKVLRGSEGAAIGGHRGVVHVYVHDDSAVAVDNRTVFVTARDRTVHRQRASSPNLNGGAVAVRHRACFRVSSTLVLLDHHCAALIDDQSRRACALADDGAADGHVRGGHDGRALALRHDGGIALSLRKRGCAAGIVQIHRAVVVERHIGRVGGGVLHHAGTIDGQCAPTLVVDGFRTGGGDGAVAVAVQLDVPCERTSVFDGSGRSAVNVEPAKAIGAARSLVIHEVQLTGRVVLDNRRERRCAGVADGTVVSTESHAVLQVQRTAVFNHVDFAAGGQVKAVQAKGDLRIRGNFDRLAQHQITAQVVVAALQRAAACQGGVGRAVRVGGIVLRSIGYLTIAESQLAVSGGKHRSQICISARVLDNIARLLTGDVDLGIVCTKILADGNLLAVFQLDPAIDIDRAVHGDGVGAAGRAYRAGDSGILEG